MTIINPGRYSFTSIEDYEPNSNNLVLKNRLGIKSIENIERLEASELKRAELELLRLFNETHQFTAKDLRNIHQLWLGDIYFFAGQYRSVNISKDNFQFSAANRIEYLMQKLESDFLAKYTPCHFSDDDELAFALGVVHVEFLLIHPFREGNGRVARLLADLMAAQAKRPPLDYQFIDLMKNQSGFKQYISAIHAGLSCNYKPIKEIFKILLMSPASN